MSVQLIVGTTRVNAPWTTGHRDYIIEAKISDDHQTKLITYFEMARDRGKWGTELYSGRNYVVGSTSPSYSRMYPKWKGLPAKYLPIVKGLRIIHRRKFAGR
tara:strand:+ start:992 stop:1297 length:306 start_codon:yes stop_codon:yes gene_type:complete